MSKLQCRRTVQPSTRFILQGRPEGTLGIAVAPAKVDPHVAGVGPAQFLQALEKCCHTRLSRNLAMQQSAPALRDVLSFGEVRRRRAAPPARFRTIQDWPNDLPAAQVQAQGAAERPRSQPGDGSVAWPSSRARAAEEASHEKIFGFHLG